jgi:5-hydroxyisourate hydrolase
MTVSTHVLDTGRGRPAAGMAVTISRRRQDGKWSVIGKGVTDGDGRVRELSRGRLEPGAYRLDFATAEYFAHLGTGAFYPEVSVVFTLSDPEGDVHVPLLLSPFGYTTYKGT